MFGAMLAENEACMAYAVRRSRGSEADGMPRYKVQASIRGFEADLTRNLRIFFRKLIHAQDRPL